MDLVFKNSPSFFIALLLVLATACNKDISKPEDCLLPGMEPISQNGAEETQKACKIPEQEAYANTDVSYVLTDFQEEQEKKLDLAVQKLKFALNSKSFKEKVLGHTYKGNQTFVDNNGMTNLEIYKSIMQASETLIPDEDYELDLDLTLYYKNNSTVGYTYPNTNRIWVNFKFFQNYSHAEVAKNLIHEWSHKNGFDHDFNKTERRNYSVPYAVGAIIEQIINNM